MKQPERNSRSFLSALAMIVIAQPALAERGGERPTLDTDGDGYVSPEEFSLSRLSERAEFSDIDTDGDNLLAKSEIRSFMREQQGDRPTLDTDGDGYITPEEFSLSRFSERADFSDLDADGDNLLSRDEIRSYMREKHGDRRGRRSES